MGSNTKLSPNQKAARKQYLADLEDLGGEIFSFDNGVTVAMMPEFANSKMMLVSISYRSDNEKKHRPKVGEFMALVRMFEESEYIKVPTRFTEDDDTTTRYDWGKRFSNIIAGVTLVNW